MSNRPSRRSLSKGLYLLVAALVVIVVIVGIDTSAMRNSVVIASATPTVPIPFPCYCASAYNYVPPLITNSTITFGGVAAVDTLNPLLASTQTDRDNINAVLNGCMAQLPYLTLGLAGWKPDQCTEVPTLQNGDESPNGLTTTIKLDPNDKWSDGTPETSDDYLLTGHLLIDPAIGGAPTPYNDIKSLSYTNSRGY